MRFFYLGRHRLCTSATALLVMAAWPAYSQRGATSATGAGTSSSTTTGSRSTSNFPSSNTNTNSDGSSAGLSRPIFLSGRVQFDDGSPANSDIRIERLCNGSTHLETHTDTKGRFYFQVGQQASVDTDASDSSSGRYMGGSNTSGMGSSGMGSSSSRGGSSTTTASLWGCELRAAYPGYRSDSVSLAMRQSMDQPELGTIILHRLANVQGSTLSMTTAMAPKHAQKDYEKGMQAAQKGKLDEAEKYFSDATDVYPKYAIAWFALGQVDQRLKKNAEARKCFQSAITADPKYVSSYDQLAFLSAQDGKWQESADYSKQALELNPVEFPSAYWYNALASYNLKRTADTEKDIRELLKLDGNHRYPEAETLLAEVLVQRGEYAEAATHLKSYLTRYPNAKDADQLKQELAKLEQASASAKK